MRLRSPTPTQFNKRFRRAALSLWYLRDLLYVQSPHVNAAVKHHLQHPDTPHMSLCSVVVIDKSTATEEPERICGTCLRMSNGIEQEKRRQEELRYNAAMKRLVADKYSKKECTFIDKQEAQDLRVVFSRVLNEQKAAILKLAEG